MPSLLNGYVLDVVCLIKPWRRCSLRSLVSLHHALVFPAYRSTLFVVFCSGIVFSSSAFWCNQRAVVRSSLHNLLLSRCARDSAHVGGCPCVFLRSRLAQICHSSQEGGKLQKYPKISSENIQLLTTDIFCNFLTMILILMSDVLVVATAVELIKRNCLNRRVLILAIPINELSSNYGPWLSTRARSI